MSIIKIQHVNKIYHESAVPVKALNNVSIEVKKGEFAAIVGPSGSGKTTLLNIIGGLDHVNEGNVIINNHNIVTMTDKELIEFRLQNIGFIFQSYNLIPVLTALENVEFIMLLQHIEKDKRQERAKKLLEDVGLKDQINIRPSELSGGQQQRIAVARALASNPSFVLADEPTANLDSVTAEKLLDLMEEMNNKLNMTFIFSSHDERVITRAKRVITLVDGSIESDVTK